MTASPPASTSEYKNLPRNRNSIDQHCPASPLGLPPPVPSLPVVSTTTALATNRAGGSSSSSSNSNRRLGGGRQSRRSHSYPWDWASTGISAAFSVIGRNTLTSVMSSLRSERQPVPSTSQPVPALSVPQNLAPSTEHADKRPRVSPKNSLRLNLPPIDREGLQAQFSSLQPSMPARPQVLPSRGATVAGLEPRSLSDSVIPTYNNSSNSFALLTPPEVAGDVRWEHSKTRLGDGMESQLQENKQSVAATPEEQPSNQKGTVEAPTSPMPESEEATDASDVVPQDPNAPDAWIQGALHAMMSRPGGETFPPDRARLFCLTLPSFLPRQTTLKFTMSSSAAASSKLPSSAQAAPQAARIAGQQLSPALEAKIMKPQRRESVSTTGGKELPVDGQISAVDDVTEALQAIHQARSLRGERSRRYVDLRLAVPESHATSLNLPASSYTASLPGSSSGYFASSPSGSPSLFAKSDSQDYFGFPLYHSWVTVPTRAILDPSVLLAQTASPLPSPRPTVPQASMHFSLVERYIPPASAAEDAALTSPSTSPLIDRLVELNPRGGTLLLIYPTRRGATTFVRSYLDAVLARLLRTFMSLYGLRDKLAWDVNRMAAVQTMRSFDLLKGDLKRFCHTLSAGDGGLELVYAERQEVRLDASSWREWWVVQERERIENVVMQYFATPVTGSDAPSGHQDSSAPSAVAAGQASSGSAGDLAREIVNGVMKMDMPPRKKMTEGLPGVEVGIFVIRRNGE